MSLVRKYRPQKLSDVCGHGAEIKRLEGIFKSKKLPQALAFLGMTGTGKTTLARIFANYAQCETFNFCGKCESCKLSMSKQGHPDVLEIDNAKARGIEEIRNLTESLRFKPSIGRYKIIILDEVQQLTPQAQQALFKSLEEPPEHLIFILCSMEPEKIGDALLTRCSQFHLQNPDADEIAKRLTKIAKKESVSISSSAIKSIAHASGGCVRLAVQSLDSAFQLIASSDDTKQAEKLIKKHVLKESVSSDDEIASSILIACQKGDVKKVHRLLLNANDCVSLINKMSYLLMYQLDSSVVQSHKNVWHTPANTNYVKQLESEGIKVYSTKAYLLMDCLNEIKIKIGGFLSNPRHVLTLELAKFVIKNKSK